MGKYSGRLKLVYISLVVVAISACMPRIPTNQTQTRDVALEDVQNEMQQKGQRVKMINEPGMIHIQRQTEEYSISMVLDASDENIYFVMDLPQEEEKIQEPVPVEEPPLPEPEQVIPEPPPEEENAVEEEKPAPVEEAATVEPEVDDTRASKYILYAQTYFLEKKYARALEEVNRAVGYSPGSAVAHSLRGSIFYKLGEKEQARNAWTRALELDESLDNVKKMLGQLDQK
ncbi:MAG: tetratricopeptide repeat protein [Gammaproteobacteria bacterium]|nr:tetratricopeptide repeat protein [Gammaproteobacteria bacterium]